MNEKRKKPRFLLRFSLASLLFSVACLAGYLSGYRVGHEEGKSIWVSYPIDEATYDISDITTNEFTADELARQIKSNIFPVVWRDNGGNCAVQVVPNEEKLILQANSLVLSYVRKHLESIRQRVSDANHVGHKKETATR